MRQTILAIFLVLGLDHVQASADCVILLHGLARTANSMTQIEQALAADDYVVVNEGYESRSGRIETLAMQAFNLSLQRCAPQQNTRIHFVTHSLGGILVRYYLSNHSLPNLGRVVMLAPPNQGSEVVDNWKRVPGFRLLNGPAGMQLGKGADSIPLALGAVDFELGVIAGSRSLNPILSLSLPNPDDGKVSVESTKVDGMADFILVPHTHTFMMNAESVIDQIRHFLKDGKFVHPPI